MADYKGEGGHKARCKAAQQTKADLKKAEELSKDNQDAHAMGMKMLGLS